MEFSVLSAPDASDVRSTKMRRRLVDHGHLQGDEGAQSTDSLKVHTFATHRGE